MRQLQNSEGDYVQMVVQHNNIRSQFSTNGSPIRISRHFQTIPRLCQSSSRRRRNLPPLPSSVNLISISLFSILFYSLFYAILSLCCEQETQLDKKNDNNFSYIVAETLHVPCNSTLRPILINRGISIYPAILDYLFIIITIIIIIGRLLMQIWNDSEKSKLAITINQATNLPSRSER